MSVRNARTLGTLALSALLVGSLLVVGGVGTQLAADDDEPATQNTSYLRVVHASPDAPAVDVAVDNESVLTGVEFGDVGDYLALAGGPHNVTISANESGAVVFEDTVTLDPRTITTIAAAGEVSENATQPFEPILYDDNAYEPAANESAVSVIHLSPDAPTVDVTVGTGNETVVLADNVSYGEASDYATVAAGNYTVDVREATEADDGPVLATVDLTLDEGSAYSALAVGFVRPENGTEPFQVIRSEDATVDVELPNTATPTPTITPPPVGNETETAVGETETEAPTETETETAAPTETETETATPTETDEPVESPTQTESGGEATTTLTEAPSPTETREPIQTQTESGGGA